MNSNLIAFLRMLRLSEGTEQPGVDPYRVCYGYKHTIVSLADHPCLTGEWKGERLPDEMCRKAGFGPGCISTAAGAYQIIKPTWSAIRKDLKLTGFDPASQDAAGVELIRRRGALAAVQAGNFGTAVNMCRGEWASLPGNSAGQGQHAIGKLAQWFVEGGGVCA